MTAMAAPPRPRLDSLTEARGIAAWFIVLYHCRVSMPWLPAPVLHGLAKGYLAVDFFFLLSGFVLYLSSRGAFARDGLRATPDFLRRRLARIYPLYATMLAVMVAFALALTLTGRDAGAYPWRDLPLHLLMMQNWGLISGLSWNVPGWSISTEFAANLLFPLAVTALPLARAGRGALLLALLALLVLLAGAMRAMGAHSLGYDIMHTGLIRCLCEFAAGCLICALWLRGADRPVRGPVLLAIALLAVGLVAWAGQADSEVWAFPLATGAALYLMAEASRRLPPPARPLRGLLAAFRWLGEISYATYLSHFLLFVLFKMLFASDAANIPPLRMAGYFAALILLSELLYRRVEQPGRRWMIARLTPRARRAKAATTP